MDWTFKEGRIIWEALAKVAENALSKESFETNKGSLRIKELPQEMREKPDEDYKQAWKSLDGDRDSLIKVKYTGKD